MHPAPDRRTKRLAIPLMLATSAGLSTACVPQIEEATIFGCSQQEPACPEGLVCDLGRGRCVYDRCEQISCQPGTVCDQDTGLCVPTGGDVAGGDTFWPAGDYLQGDHQPGGDSQPYGDLEAGDHTPGDSTAPPGDSGPSWSALADGTRSSEICSASEQCPASSGGGLAPDAYAAGSPALALDELGHIYLAWQQKVGAYDQIRLRSWDSSSWTELAGSATGAGVSANPDFDARYPSLSYRNGALALAWQGATASDTEIFCKVWEGGSWSDLGGSGSGSGLSNNTGTSEYPRVVLNSSGFPVVAWSDNTVGTANPGGLWQIHLRAWNGATWSNLAGSAGGDCGGISRLASGGAYGPALGLHRGTGEPIVAWTQWDGNSDYSVVLRQWDGSTWQGLAGSAAGNGLDQTDSDCSNIDLVTTSNGSTIVAWEQVDSGRTRIAVRMYDSTIPGWRDVGSTRFISPTHSALRPRLTMDPFELPIVAWHGRWQSSSPAAHEVFVSRFDGMSWSGWGGALQEGGISRSDTDSHTALVPGDALSDFAPVAWVEDGADGGNRIFLRWSVLPWID